MKSEPLISIIVPVYKVEKYLAECVHSIMAQEHRNLEIILIDDGSPDDCPRMCDEFAKEDTRIRVIHQENAGVSAARNAGLDAASGEWIGFVDSDDVIHKSMYKRLHEMVGENGSDIATCCYAKFSSSSYAFSPMERTVDFSVEGLRVVQDALVGKRLFLLCVSLYRACIFREHAIRFPPVSYGEDVYVSMWAGCYANKVTFTEAQWYGYRQHETNATAQSLSPKYDGLQMGTHFRDMVAGRVPELIPYAEILCSSLGHDRLMSVIRAGDRQMLRAVGKDLRRHTLMHWKASPARVRRETHPRHRAAIWVLRYLPWVYAPMYRAMAKLRRWYKK